METTYNLNDLRLVIGEKIASRDIITILRPCKSLNIYIDFDNGFMIHIEMDALVESDNIPLRLTVYDMNYTGEVTFDDNDCVHMEDFKCQEHIYVGSYTVLSQMLAGIITETKIRNENNWQYADWQNSSADLTYGIMLSICVAACMEYDPDFDGTDDYIYDKIPFDEYPSNKLIIDSMIEDLLKSFGISGFNIYDDYVKKPTSVYSPCIELSSTYNNRLYKFNTADIRKPSIVDTVLQYLNNTVDGIDRVYAPDSILPVLYADISFVFVNDNFETTDSCVLCVSKVMDNLAFTSNGYYELIIINNRVKDDCSVQCFKNKKDIIDKMIAIIVSYFEKHKDEMCGISYSCDSRLHLFR